VLVLVLGLLAIGGIVKVYRAAHPPPASASQPNHNMQEVNFEEVVAQIVAKDGRYQPDAYFFCARRWTSPRR